MTDQSVTGGQVFPRAHLLYVVLPGFFRWHERIWLSGKHGR